jgi:hypothetical protein
MISANWANRTLLQNLPCEKEPANPLILADMFVNLYRFSPCRKQLAPEHRAVFVTTNTCYVIHIAQTKMLRLSTVKGMGIVGPTEFKRNQVSGGRGHTGDAEH